MNVKMSNYMRTALTASRPLTSTPACLVPSPIHLRCISSLSNPSSHRKLRHKALRGPLSPLLARLLPGSRNSSTSHQELPLSAVEAENIEKAPPSSLSPDQFARQVLRESTESPRSDLIRKIPTGEVSPVSQPTASPSLLLLSLFERLIPRGLVPQVSAKPPYSVRHEPAWTVAISLPELGIDVKGRGSNILFAEVAAAIQFDLALSSPESVAKLPPHSKPRFSTADANDIVQSYYQFIHASTGPLKKTVTQLNSGAYEAQIFAGSTEIGEPVTLAVKNAARIVQNLTLAHGIVNDRPDVWPISLKNPFQASIVLDSARLEKLQHLITQATNYLHTTPGQVVGNKGRGAFHKVVQGVPGRNTGDAQEGGSEGAHHGDIPDLQSWLATLPFPPATAKLLVAGASIRRLEHAILLAAIEKHAIYRETASGAEDSDGYRNPATMNVMEGDHSGLVWLFERFRDERWFGKKHMRLPKTEDGQGNSSEPQNNAHNPAKEDVTPDTDSPMSDRKSVQASPKGLAESVQRSSTETAMIAKRFDHFDPRGIASVSATAKNIERSMITAGLASHPKETSFISVPGSELKIRAEPYGGDLSGNMRRMSLLRHLLVLGFPENIAQIGYGTLAPGKPPQLRINSQEVHVDSPLKSYMPQKQLYRNLRSGPLMVVTGVTNNSEDGGLVARYCTPISTWEAVLLGKDLTLPNGKETSVADAVHVIVNNWLPVLVKSEVEGVSNEQARDTLFEAREVLHRAIDKAMYEYVKYSWHSLEFYKLLNDLPNEDSFAGKAAFKEKQASETTA